MCMEGTQSGLGSIEDTGGKLGPIDCRFVALIRII